MDNNKKSSIRSFVNDHFYAICGISIISYVVLKKVYISGYNQGFSDATFGKIVQITAIKKK